jgi:hypothetical protein
MPSGPGGNTEFPPLLAIGRHLHSVQEMETLCVTAFPKSATRPTIMAGLHQVIAKLDDDVGIVGELWADGSFLTKKVDPEDVDLVLRMQSDFADTCNAEQDAVIQWVASDLHASHHCHSFVLVHWPEGHQFYWQGGRVRLCLLDEAMGL